MKNPRPCLILITCTLTLCLMASRIYSADKVRFGLNSGLGYSLDGVQRNGLGVFMHYAVSPKISFELEFKNPVAGSSTGRAGDINVFETLTKKEWSTRLAFNYFLKNKQGFAPYLGIGVGNYYSCVSKTRIKSAKADIHEDNIDYDLRKLLRRPGVFATFGMQYCVLPNVTVYMQAKSTLLFEESKSLPIVTEPGFSDLINVSTGLRFNLN